MKKKSDEKNLKLYLRILGYLRPYAFLLLVILTLNFLYVIFNTLSIWMVAPFISTLFESGKPAVEQQIQPPSEEQSNSILNLNKSVKIQNRAFDTTGQPDKSASSSVHYYFYHFLFEEYLQLL